MKLGELSEQYMQHQKWVIELHPRNEDERISSRDGRRLRGKKAAKPIISIVMLGAVIGFLASNYDFSEILSDLRQLSSVTIFITFAALLANALVATLRFKTIAADIGHLVSFRKAMATVSAGNLAGAMFFQIAGQLIGRSVAMGRSGVPFANVVVITAYERVVAAILSALLGLAGAYYIFGAVYLDQNAGGVEFIKIACGLIAATTLGAMFGYARLAAQSIAPLLSRKFTRRFLRVVGLTLLVQAPMMVAYVTLATALSPQTLMPYLVAASAVVMFAASVPISFAGWGVREMSAIAALGAIGVPGHAAFTAAVLVGIGSLLAMGVIGILAVSNSVDDGRPAEHPDVVPIDFSNALSWFLPLSAATLVLFQIYVPVGSGLLNVNLADPIAILAGAYFVLKAITKRRAPKWRTPGVNSAAAIATAILTLSLLIGWWRFGWITWAWVNRFIGWFVLLGYATTGALIVMDKGKQALRTVLLTFVSATAAIAGIEVVLAVLHGIGTKVASQLVSSGPIEGFAQNRNSFALQLLMATSAAIVFVRGTYLRAGVLALMFATFLFAGSRSGWIAITIVIGISLYLRKMTVRELLIASMCAIGLSCLLSSGSGDSITPVLEVVPTHESTQERLTSVLGGLKLFAEHPIFGAGLGAFQNQKILTNDGLPLVIHSTAIWLLAESGIVGFLTFALPALYIFASEWRSARKDEASAVIVLCLAAFAVMAVPADMLYQRAFWFVIGTALALRTTIPGLLSKSKPGSHGSAPA